ncbi:tyrosine-type recombinase/integrase [Clostridium sp. 19966]|uniref:tyrosine-type recombinase/integrase n=1 Tax=Clostridium sp. 19966 TaxID=2768166 RepID=UPI0028DE873B|nr:tyrosine-type recombinase/integrase [Clostridium sp. 19966]MDT8715229.1 tyrosine-type recombinase/integrase [Clostridium sp. 19966]
MSIDKLLDADYEELTREKTPKEIHNKQRKEQKIKKRNQIPNNWNMAIESFLEDRRIRNCATQTLVFYRDNLKYFYRDFIEPEGIERPIDFTEDDLKDYIDFLRENANKTSSINIRLRALRSFYNYLFENEYMTKKLKIKQLKEDKEIIETFTQEQIKKMLIKPAIKGSLAIYRDYITILTLLGTGVRLNSLVNIRIGDIDFEKKEIRINTTKGREQLILPLDNYLKKNLQEYINTFDFDEDNYLICTQFGEKIAKRTVQDRINIYCKKLLGEDVRCNIHKFRHTFALEYIRSRSKNGSFEHGSLLVLQRLMAHKQIQTTMVYLNLLQEDIRRDFFNNSPLSVMADIKQKNGRKAIKMNVDKE